VTALNWTSIFQLLKETASAWVEGKAPRLGAALAYYTVFAIAPLFVIVLALAGLWFGEEAARRELFNQIHGLVGREGGEAIQAMVIAANKPKAGLLATGIAFLTLFIGATGVFVQLQDALNTVWSVKRKPGRGLRHFVRDRLLSFAMVLGIGFLLLVSLVLSAGLAAISQLLKGPLPAQEIIWQGATFTVSLAVITLLFAMIFKVLPDVRIAWRDVWAGALMTALLFNLGKFLLGNYLGRSSLVSVYGAAGSFVIVLLWVYYSAQIVLFGAEFTRVYAIRRGFRLKPGRGSHFVTVTELRSRPGKALSHDQRG
jgi:membrane protein